MKPPSCTVRFWAKKSVNRNLYYDRGRELLLLYFRAAPEQRALVPHATLIVGGCHQRIAGCQRRQHSRNLRCAVRRLPRPWRRRWSTSRRTTIIVRQRGCPAAPPPCPWLQRDTHADCYSIGTGRALTARMHALGSSSPCGPPPRFTTRGYTLGWTHVLARYLDRGPFTPPATTTPWQS